VLRLSPFSVRLLLPDLLVVDIDSNGIILHPEPFDFTLAYPDWYHALDRKIRTHGPLAPGTTFVWDRAIQPTTIIGAVSVANWNRPAHLPEVESALRHVAAIAQARKAKRISVTALGTRNGMKIATIISRIKSWIARNDRTVEVLLFDELDDCELAETGDDDASLIVHYAGRRERFVCGKTLYAVKRGGIETEHPRGSWIVTPRSGATSTTPIYADDIAIVRPAHAGDRATYPSATIQRVPYRASLELGEPLLQHPSIDAPGLPLPLPWTSDAARVFLWNEAFAVADYKLVSLRDQTPHRPQLEGGVYVGRILWCNEGHLIQRTTRAIVIHDVANLSFCVRCNLRLGRDAQITYHDGTAEVHRRSHGAHDDFLAQRLSTVSRDGGIDVAAIAPELAISSGYADALAELAIGLMLSPRKRQAFAKIVAHVRATRSFRFAVYTDDPQRIASICAIADVVALRYGSWTRTHPYDRTALAAAS
jgi:hypothetical protein